MSTGTRMRAARWKVIVVVLLGAVVGSGCTTRDQASPDDWCSMFSDAWDLAARYLADPSFDLRAAQDDARERWLNTPAPSEISEAWEVYRDRSRDPGDPAVQEAIVIVTVYGSDNCQLSKPTRSFLEGFTGGDPG